MGTSAVKRFTVDQYLAIELEGEVKHEFFDGEIFAMAGGTLAHSLICPTGLRTYPDVSVVCESPRFEDDREITLLNPQVIVEVLSESTEAYDRGKKFDSYQSMESLREYVLVSQDRPHVDRFSRQESGDWLLAKSEGLEAEVSVPSLGCSVRMAEIYANVEFEKRPSEPKAE